MKTLRFVNKHINESIATVSGSQYNDCVFFAVNTMDEEEIDHALYIMDRWHTSFDQCTEYDTFKNNVAEWCELHDVSYDDIYKACGYDWEKAFFDGYALKEKGYKSGMSESMNEELSDQKFTKACFKKAAAYALSCLTDTETDYALERFNSGYAIHTLHEIAEKISDAMSEWCEEGGFDPDAWRNFGNVDDVFFSDGNDDDDDYEMSDAPGTQDADVSDNVRKECYNIAYNLVLSKMPAKNSETMTRLPYAFYSGYMAMNYDISGEDAEVYKEANRLGAMARKLSNVQNFMHWLEIEYDV